MSTDTNWDLLDREDKVVSDGRTPASEERPRARRRRLRRALLGLGIAVLVVVALVVGGAWYLTNRYVGQMQRVDGVFDGLQNRPAPADPGPTGAVPLTFLVVGSDTREPVATGALPDARSDVTMLVRFTGDRRSAQVVSLPRDSWVPIPGHGMAKLNAAYAWGGPRLLIQTIEHMTGIRIDHYAAMDFEGFVQMTNSLGGVDVQVAKTVSDGTYTYQAGWNHLDGKEALSYVRQRHGLPGGDFDREKRQQAFLRAMFAKLAKENVTSDLGAFDGFLRGLTRATAVDSGLSDNAVLETAYSLRSLRPTDLTFLTAPVAGTGRESTQDVVYLDAVRSGQMWGYLRADDLTEHVGEFGLASLPDVPN